MNESVLQVGKTRSPHCAICAEREGLILLAMETNEDHIHVFVSALPRFSPPLIANLLKGESSRYLREQFPHLKKVCGKDHLWTSAYSVGTAGSVSAKVIPRSIMECQGKECDVSGVAFIPSPRTGREFPLPL